MSTSGLTREDAIELVRRLLKKSPDKPTYYTEPFMPHEWCIEAIQVAYRKGVRIGARGGDTPTVIRVVSAPSHEEAKALQQLHDARLVGTSLSEFVDQLLILWKAKTGEASSQRHQLNEEGSAAWDRLAEVSEFGETYSQTLVRLVNAELKRRYGPGSTIAALGGVTEPTAAAREATARQEGFDAGLQEGRQRLVMTNLDRLAVALYDAAAAGFHTSESSGVEAKFRQVARFGTLADLQEYYSAWVALMTFIRKAQERDDG